jgi:hypothetical protein
MNGSSLDFKNVFVDRVSLYVEESLIERYLEEYIYSLESNLRESVWQQFDCVKDIVDDFKQFVEYAQECDLIEL